MIVKRLDRLSSKQYLLAILALLFVLDIFALWFSAKVDYDRTLENGASRTGENIHIARRKVETDSYRHRGNPSWQSLKNSRERDSGNDFIGKGMGTIPECRSRATGCRYALAAGQPG